MKTVFFTELPADHDPPLPLVVLARCLRLVATPEPEVLILGYGLGSMGAVMARLRPRACILGVELDQGFVHRAAAHAPGNVALEQGDAASFLRRSRRHFDLVVDDCFVMRQHDPLRAPALDGSGGVARRRLRTGGVYARNLLPLDGRELERQIADVRAAFPHVLLRRFRDWDNVLAIASDRQLGEEDRRLLRR